MIPDRTGQIWYDTEGSSEPELFIVVGPHYPTEWQSDEPGSVYHCIAMLYKGKANGWRESPSEVWENLEHMRRIA